MLCRFYKINIQNVDFVKSTFDKIDITYIYVYMYISHLYRHWYKWLCGLPWLVYRVQSLNPINTLYPFILMDDCWTTNRPANRTGIPCTVQGFCPFWLFCTGVQGFFS